ncbi:hypothetical protein COSO111634_18665 [Corallococcus soli]
MGCRSDCRKEAHCTDGRASLDFVDTTAAVAGGIAGLQYGLKGIPHRWRSMLRGEELVAPLLDRLLKPQP